MSYIVRVEFPDGSNRHTSCESKGQAKRVYLQAMHNPVVERCGGLVTCEDALTGAVVDILARNTRAAREDHHHRLLAAIDENMPFRDV